MLILADRHHSSLYASLHYLFEDRLGHELYNPIERDWFSQGFWRIANIYNNSEQTIEQYLGTSTSFASAPFDGIYRTWDPQHEIWVKGITLDKFLKMPFDVVIASVPEHVESFKRLCQEHPNHPKFIYQIGNDWPVEANSAPNIMASAKVRVPSGVNFVEYLQEFRLDVFKAGEISQTNKIHSFINCLNTADIYKKDWPLFTETEALMTDWKWRTFGGSCRDGYRGTINEIAETMNQARFGWHVKHKGDGYGHVLFNWAAVGKPVITKLSDYRGKLGEMLLRDGETCLDIDGLTPAQIKDKVLTWDTPESYSKLVANISDNFKNKVNFAIEAEKIRQFLSRLQ